jgi:hypothetical protein
MARITTTKQDDSDEERDDGNEQGMTGMTRRDDGDDKVG